MIVVWITGPLLAWQQYQYKDGWLHVKFALVLLLTGYHHALGYWRKAFLADQNQKTTKFFRIANEVPTLLMTGDADLWIPPALLYRISGKFRNSETTIVRDAGHAIQWERPVIFNTHVLDFIGRQSRR